WENIEGTFDKLYEEIEEFRKAPDDEATMEAGDVLFSAVNPMRWRHIEPELALKASCDKFLKRFRYMESEILKAGKDLSDAAVLDEYWRKAKEIYK
ncbi:MAG: nucleoside triphosphate pyrophosphohydrolase, partial [Eubacteriales bacterium]|nr:nucleoside triphosphate pyrophosphohydrolase [Eubacteriales bacterium]